ncbi:MAG TPA: hypothetical protein VN665_00100 [Candidatus Paceibacterota bacterium]|nr:hypothetical protein [Candidatus Paceibacterota bacterium]
MNSNRTIWIATISILVLLLAVFLVWFFIFRSNTSVSTTGTTSGFGVPDTNNTAPAATDTSANQTINTTTTAPAQKIFEITPGPVVGATLLQTLRPTTTIARYIRQDDGHVFDVPLGVAGAVPKVVSNITIPGGQRAIWLEGGNAAILQYIDDTSVVKTVYLGFPVATTSPVTQTATIKFLPDNIIDIAASPDGKSVIYLIKTAGGADGYVAQSSGINSRKMFSLPLSQLLISWPSQNTILVQTTSAAGISGIAFAVDAKTGAASQLLTAPGLSVIADKTFSNVIYGKSDGTTESTYTHNIKNATNTRLSFNPIPEKCTWSNLNTTSMYCAAPLQATSANYLDLWHAGTASDADTLFSFNVAAGTSTILASPGSADGGTAADILEMALSPSEQYLSYTTKGDRSLWGVLLSQ